MKRISLSVVTLGVQDIARSRAFYESLGLAAAQGSNAHVTFFDANGVVLALYGRCALAKDACVEDSAPGFAGATLAWNVEDPAAVDACMARAVDAGAKVVKPAQKAFWGGYHGYFSDPDGHLWEVAHNPFWPLDGQGRPQLPGRAKKT